MKESQKEGRAVRIANTISDSIVDGPGLRLTVFAQGCPHRCPDCHNPETHDPAGGREAELAELIALLDTNPLLQGLTLSGGDPFLQAAECAALARAARDRGLDVWTYTGWTYALFRGSDNQRLIDLRKTEREGRVVLWTRPDPLAHFTVPES